MERERHKLLNEHNTHRRSTERLRRGGVENRPARLQLHRGSRIRDELVARVRAEIEAGTYLTDARINSAVRRIFCVLNSNDGRPDAPTLLGRAG
jgi:hypothetical protein